MTDDDARFVTEFIDSMFPLTPRVPGVIFDAFVSNASVNNCSLEAIRVPTLVVHTKDDPLASHEASERAARRVPGAEFLSLESGGHLMLGQAGIVHDRLAEFFAGRSGEQIQEAQMRGPPRHGLAVAVLYKRESCSSGGFTQLFQQTA